VTKPLSFLDLDKKYLVPMSEEASKALVMTTMTELALKDEDKQHMLMFQSPEYKLQRSDLLGAPARIIASRLKEAQTPARIMQTVIAFLPFVSSSQTPAEAVIWAWTLHNMRGRVVDMEYLSSIFDIGFPSYEGFIQIWDAQKGAGGNLLDQSETWKD
jgi:hypothetical protein